MPWNSLRTKLHVTPVQLSVDDVKRAQTYLPMLHKKALIEQLVNGCIQRVNITVNDLQPIPPRVQEDSFAKTLILTTVLCGFYLDIYDASSLLAKEPTFEMSMSECDNYATVLLQLERMRKHPDNEVRANAHAILSDFRDFEKRMNLAIYNKMAAKNDLCARFVEMMDVQVAPDNLKKAQDQLKSLQTELENLQKVSQRQPSPAPQPDTPPAEPAEKKEG